MLSSKYKLKAWLKTSTNLYLPTHKILVLITQVSSKGTDEASLSCSPARAFAYRIHSVWKQMEAQN